MGLGGASARRMALGVQSASDAQLSLFFSQVRAGQTAPHSVLVRINTGLNDRNETLVSLGPAAITDADSAAAFTDNIVAIFARIESIWSLNGWALEELYFLISVSHPVSTPDDAELVLYREAAEALAATRPRTAATRFDRLTDSSEMLANGWYQSEGGDRNHLTLAAFEALSRREIDAARPLPCIGDANNDAQVNFADITAILTAFSQCAPLPGQGDADGDRLVRFADITAVLTAWETGCN
jgi:hypothetical protein